MVVPSLAAKGAVINVGIIELMPNQAGQWKDIWVEGGESVYALEFLAQVGQGSSGPKISNVDLLSGIFDGNNVGQDSLDLDLPDGMLPDYVVGFTTQQEDISRVVLANGILARVQFNTIGMFASPESWDFLLTGVAAGATGAGRNTALFDDGQQEISLTITNGSLRIVPEPSSLLLALSGLGLASAVYAARRRARRSHSQTV
jgi:hypothetical protein